MIELPHEFLNVLFTLLIVFASVSRSKERVGALAPQSIGLYR